MSQFGGVSIFQKCLKFKNVPNVGGGGVNPNWDMSQIFLLFYFDAFPKIWYVGLSKAKKVIPQPLLTLNTKLDPIP